ncbi:hypothetical protein [Methanobrevibacter sp.]
MAEKTVRLIESIRNEAYDRGYDRRYHKGYHDGYHKGFNECKMQFIKNALRKCSVDEIADLLCLSVSEVQKYVEM